MGCCTFEELSQDSKFVSDCRLLEIIHAHTRHCLIPSMEKALSIQYAQRSNLGSKSPFMLNLAFKNRTPSPSGDWSLSVFDHIHFVPD